MKSAEPERPHNYESAVRKFAEEHHIPPGRVSEIAVSHDDNCGFLVSGGRCDCDPEVKLLKTHGDVPEGPPRKLRPKDPILWAKLRRGRGG